VGWFAGLMLLLHVGGAIVGFGPTFTFPIIGSAGGREPAHVNFALRTSQTIATRLVMPLAILQGITGVLLIWALNMDLFAHAWLLTGIVLYVAALVIVFGNNLPVGRRLIELTSTPPPAPAPAASAPAPGASAPAPGAPARSGPPPEVAALVRRSRAGGAITGTLLILIIILMVLGSNGFLS
jgi:Predicted integral membrane protein (DUF2269)